MKDLKGQVISGADLHVEATGGSSRNDNGLDVGTYRVTLVVNGSAKPSILNVKTKLGNSTKFNFDLKASTSSQASAPGETKDREAERASQISDFESEE